jgi:hypothetical protein
MDIELHRDESAHRVTIVIRLNFVTLMYTVTEKMLEEESGDTLHTMLNSILNVVQTIKEYDCEVDLFIATNSAYNAIQCLESLSRGSSKHDLM